MTTKIVEFSIDTIFKNKIFHLKHEISILEKFKNKFEFITINDASKKLSCDEKTIIELINDGKLLRYDIDGYLIIPSFQFDKNNNIYPFISKLINNVRDNYFANEINKNILLHDIARENNVINNQYNTVLNGIQFLMKYEDKAIDVISALFNMHFNNSFR